MSLSVIEIRGFYPVLHVRAFSLVGRPTMPSADFCPSIPPPLDDDSSSAERQISPGNAHSLSRLCPPHIRPCLPYRYWTLKICAFSSGMAASYAVSVRQASVLPPASFRSHLAMGTLAVRLTVPPVGPVKDSHLQVSAPCRAHTKKVLKNGFFRTIERNPIQSSPIRTVTVGSGVSPDLSLKTGLAGFTAGGDLHPALKIVGKWYYLDRFGSTPNFLWQPLPRRDRRVDNRGHSDSRSHEE